MRLFYLLLFTLISADLMAVEEPAHQVLLSEQNMEIRSYEPMLLAEVEVSGSMRSAGNQGFRTLADYIFGNNIAAEASTDELSGQLSQRKSQKIEMTAPVARVETSADTWTVSFVMPSEWTLDTLPKPNNPDVLIRQQPESLMASIEFSGRASENDHRVREQELRRWLAEIGYEALAEAQYAGYNPPWTLGPFRRNEVLIPVAEIAHDQSKE